MENYESWWLITSGGLGGAGSQGVVVTNADATGELVVNGTVNWSQLTVVNGNTPGNTPELPLIGSEPKEDTSTLEARFKALAEELA